MIKRKAFDTGNFKKRVYSRADHPIAKLLRNNTSYALKAKEIANKVNMNENTVRSMLRNLVKDGLVLHKAPYFAWKK
jgi:predicted transcriptional regulator